MAIKFTCPQCEVAIQVPDSMADKSGKCPKCGTKVTVPHPEPNPGRPFTSIPVVPPLPDSHDRIALHNSAVSDPHSSVRMRVLKARLNRSDRRVTLAMVAFIATVLLVGGIWWAFRGPDSESVTIPATAGGPAKVSKHDEKITAELSPQSAESNAEDVARTPAEDDSTAKPGGEERATTNRSIEYSFTATSIDKASKEDEANQSLKALQVALLAGESLWIADCQVQLVHKYSRDSVYIRDDLKNGVPIKMLDSDWFTVINVVPDKVSKSCHVIAFRSPQLPDALNAGGFLQGSLYQIDQGSAGPARITTSLKGQLFFVAPEDAERFSVSFLSSESVSLHPQNWGESQIGEANHRAPVNQLPVVLTPNQPLDAQFKEVLPLEGMKYKFVQQGSTVGIEVEGEFAVLREGDIEWQYKVRGVNGKPMSVKQAGALYFPGDIWLEQPYEVLDREGNIIGRWPGS